VKMTVAELTQGLSGLEVRGDPAAEVSGIVCDSRKVVPGDLFAAVPGTEADGAAFAPAAIEAGASAVMMRTPEKLPVPVIVTDRVRIMMGILAGRLLGHPDHRVNLVGITGTNGKTTTSYLIESIVAAAGMKAAVIGTVNYRFGDTLMPAATTTPESIDTLRMLDEMSRAGADHAVIEVSSHALHQGRMGGMSITTAVFTNLSRDHLDYHGDLEDYYQAKKRLFTEVITGQWDPDRTAGRTPLAIINMDDEHGQRLCRELEGSGVEIKGYAIENERAWLRAAKVSRSRAGIKAVLLAPGIEMPVSSSLAGMHNLENILAAAAAGLSLGADPAAVSRGVNSLASVPGRLERVGNDQDITVMVDYAHTPEALERAVKTCGEVAQGRLITVFGCGGDRDRGKRPLMGRVAAEGSHVTVVTSDNPRTEDPLSVIEMILEGVREVGAVRAGSVHEAVSRADDAKVFLVQPDRREAIKAAVKIARPGDLVLIAGKGHEDYQVLGAEKIHFDDREEAERALDARKMQ